MTKRYYPVAGGNHMLAGRWATLDALKSRPDLQLLTDEWLDLHEDETRSELDGFTRKGFKPVFGPRSISI
jgi:hypothetical protein